MNKDCQPQSVKDYSATYKFYINGISKEIKYPACRDELSSIEIVYIPLFNQSSDKDNDLLFLKREQLEPTADSGLTIRSTEIYNSGKVITRGRGAIVKSIDQEVVEAVKTKIKETDIMNKDCQTEPVVDYKTTYYVVQEDQAKSIILPNCSGQLKEIEQVYIDHIK